MGVGVANEMVGVAVGVGLGSAVAVGTGVCVGVAVGNGMKVGVKVGMSVGRGVSVGSRSSPASGKHQQGEEKPDEYGCSDPSLTRKPTATLRVCSPCRSACIGPVPNLQLDLPTFTGQEPATHKPTINPGLRGSLSHLEQYRGCGTKFSS